MGESKEGRTQRAIAIVGGLLSGENLVVEFLPSCSRELFELAYVLGVEVGVIPETIPGTCRYDVFNVLTEAVVVISRISWVRGRSFVGYVSTEIDSKSYWTNV